MTFSKEMNKLGGNVENREDTMQTKEGALKLKLLYDF